MILVWLPILPVGMIVMSLASGCVLVVTHYERGVVFRFCRVLPKTRGPGLALIAPIADRLRKINMQIITQPVPAQDGITRDNVTVRVDAVIYYRVGFDISAASFVETLQPRARRAPAKAAHTPILAGRVEVGEYQCRGSA